MFRIKKKGREKAQRLHQTLKDQLSPHLTKLGERLRLRARIRWANIWGRNHPKKLMVYYSTFAIALLSGTVLIDFLTPKAKSQDLLGLQSIPKMDHRLQSLNNSEIQTEKIKMELATLGQKGLIIYNELDSLMKLPVKTHEDSVRIITNYNILNDTFNKHGHELQKN